MRDRLIELLKLPSNCMPHSKCGSCGLNCGCSVQRQADKLLANGVIVPPCKVGDKVYIIDEDYAAFCDDPCVVEVEVLMVYITKNGIAVDLSLPLGFRLNTWAEVGKTLFLTREEAEKALAERSAE